MGRRTLRLRAKEDANHRPAELSGASKERSASERLEEAVRDIVRDTLANPQKAPDAHFKPTFSSVFWVCVAIANALLIVTQLPESLFKNTSFEVASQLLGYMFGGVLIFYSSWIRQRVVNLLDVRWFQASQIIVLVALVLTRLPLFAVYPTMTPRRAQVTVDNESITPASIRPLRLAFGNHLVRIAPPRGEEKLPDGTEVAPQEFVITWQEQITRWQRRYVPRWSPLYPVAITSTNDKSTVTIERTDDAIRPELVNAQSHPDVEFGSSVLIVFLEGGAEIQLPIGAYSFFEQQNGKVCKPHPVSIGERRNRVELRCEQ